ncbi:MAG: glycoside hydrolase family 9 protein [Candidatus Marinimicrobia bacterium]|nr:glycoside hydrolase family 9 protein [Candidatus Neomarinimicrobiota bacterium]
MRPLHFIVLLLLGQVTLQAGESWIRINQAGYQPDAIKVAVLASQNTKLPRRFELIEVLSGEVVLRSKQIRSYGAYGSFDQIQRLDFSQFTTPGRYLIKAGATRSPEFTIHQDIYQGAADFLLKYMRQQRCGYNPFLQDSCHTRDGFIVDFPQQDSMHIDVTGGWHDASDYLQYVTTSANATYQMLFAYEQNPSAFGDEYDRNGDPGSNGIPDVLDEAKWGLDWLNKMNPEAGIMFNQIADDRDHTKFTLPSLDSVDYGKGRQRPVYLVTGKPQGLGLYKNRSTGVSSSAAKYASTFAMGAKLLQAYYPEFSQHIARKSLEAYDFARSDLGVCQTASNRSPYFYEEDNYVDDMELAAVQLFQQTHDERFFKEAVYWGKLEKVTPWMKDNEARHYQWYPFVNLGHYKIAALADSTERSIFIAYLQQGIEAINERAQANGFLMGIPYIWCSNNLVAAALTQVSLYQTLTGDDQYSELEAAMRDWLLGCNPWGTSMIVGYPAEGDTPVDPHAAQTAVFGLEIDGGLVDGPVYTSIFESLRGLKIVNGDEYAAFQSDLCVYHDDYGDYSTNEPTMDGTASLTYYFSALGEKDRGEKLVDLSYNQGAITRGNLNQPTIHLVFTGHDYNDGGSIIQAVLKQQNVPAHFFFTGDFYRNPDNKSLIKKLRKDGHYLGAHSDKHLLYASWEKRDSLLVSRSEFTEDLKQNYQELARFGVSRSEAPLFMPSYEWYNDDIARWSQELGLTLINYTPGTRSHADYTTPEMGKAYVDSQTLYDNILKYESSSDHGLNGFILLIHLGTHADRTDKLYNKLDSLISELKNRGYQFSLMNFHLKEG